MQVTRDAQLCICCHFTCTGAGRVHASERKHCAGLMETRVALSAAPTCCMRWCRCRPTGGAAVGLPEVQPQQHQWSQAEDWPCDLLPHLQTAVPSAPAEQPAPPPKRIFNKLPPLLSAGLWVCKAGCDKMRRCWPAVPGCLWWLLWLLKGSCFLQVCCHNYLTKARPL